MPLHPLRVDRIGLAVLAGCVMVFMVVAGLSKLVSLDRFWWILVLDHGFPAPLATAAAVAVPSAEVLLGGLWIVSPFRRAALIGAVVLLLGLSGYLGYLLTVRREPTCGCVGVLARYGAWAESTRFGIGRNLAMIVILILHRVSWHPTDKPRPEKA